MVSLLLANEPKKATKGPALASGESWQVSALLCAVVVPHFHPLPRHTFAVAGVSPYDVGFNRRAIGTSDNET